MVTGAFGPVTVTGGLSGAKMTVPPRPGPPALNPAVSTMPTGRPRLWGPLVLPRVSVMAPPMVRSLPAQMEIFPSVVVMAASELSVMSWPALSRTLPLVVVMAASTLMSRPQHTTRLPLVAVTDALMFTSRSAFNVNVVVLVDAVQATASLMMMSPSPGVLVLRSHTGGVPGVSTSPPVCVLMTTLFWTSRAESCAPVILPPVSMMKSCGSISHVPVRPAGAAVVMLTSGAMFTMAADVSMKPPLPPWGALASSVPPTFTVPSRMSPSSRIVPLRFWMVRASMMPVLLTTVLISWPAACAVITTWPPSARKMPPFWISAFTAPLSTVTLSRPLPATSRVTASPATSATVPRLATIRPSLVTLEPSNAT